MDIKIGSSISVNAEKIVVYQISLLMFGAVELAFPRKQNNKLIVA